MKKIVLGIIMLSFLFNMSDCEKNVETDIKNTFEKTPADLIEEYIENSKEVTTTTYYEMGDGTWETDDHVYKYRLAITGRMNNAACDTTYIILSNIENITFDQAWKASGLSSHSGDYFEDEDAVIVAARLTE